VKILIIHNFYQQSGGEDVVFFAEIDLLKRYGHKVIEFSDTNNQFDNISNLSRAKEMIWSRSANSNLFFLLKSENPDLVHFHNTFTRISPSAYYVCKKLGIPIIQTLHNYRLICPLIVSAKI